MLALVISLTINGHLYATFLEGNERTIHVLLPSYRNQLLPLPMEIGVLNLCYKHSTSNSLLQ